MLTALKNSEYQLVVLDVMMPGIDGFPCRKRKEIRSFVDNGVARLMELLEQLLKENYKMSIVSNKFDKAVKELNQVYFEKYIKVAIGESKNVSKKPAPDTVFKALKELDSNTNKAVYVGDSEVDVKTAQNSKLTCIGVTWG